VAKIDEKAEFVKNEAPESTAQQFTAVRKCVLTLKVIPGHKTEDS